MSSLDRRQTLNFPPFDETLSQEVLSVKDQHDFRLHRTQGIGELGLISVVHGPAEGVSAQRMAFGRRRRY